jgi:DNA helicase-2/ATP-dependent DNA helicase PcrA
MEITAVTFTNKAANEMKKRCFGTWYSFLSHAIMPRKLMIGTFHATCAKYLRRYGQLIDLPNNFSITDADDW